MAHKLLSGTIVVKESTNPIEYDSRQKGWLVDSVLYCDTNNEFTVVDHVTTISMRQARLALLQANLLNDVNSQVALMAQDVQIAWEYATEVVRTDPLVLGIQQLLGWTDQQVDDLFVLASGL